MAKEYKYSSQDIKIDEHQNILTNITDTSFRNNTCFIGHWFDISQETEPQTLKFAINNLSSPSCFFVGIASNDDITNDLMVECLDTDTTYAYCGNGRLYKNNTEHKTVDDCKDKDVLEMTLYPEDRSLRLIINDKNEIILFEHILATKYRFGISLCFAEDSLTVLNENPFMIDTPRHHSDDIATTYHLSINTPSSSSTLSISPSTNLNRVSPTSSTRASLAATKQTKLNTINTCTNDTNSGTNCETQNTAENVNGKCDVDIRRLSMSLSIFVMTSLSFGLWFSSFTTAHVLSGCGACLLCIASLISVVLHLHIDCICPNQLQFFEYRIEMLVPWLYVCGSALYLIGGCVVVDVYNKYGLSHYAAIWFAEQAFVALYGVICGIDAHYRRCNVEWMSYDGEDNKYRVMLYNANIMLLAVILLFGYAVSCAMGDSRAIVLTMFYLCLIVVNAAYFVLIWKGNQVPLTVGITHFVCICGIAIGYLVLIKQVTPVYKAYWVGFALFVLLNGSVMSFDMATTHEKQKINEKDAENMAQTNINLQKSSSNSGSNLRCISDRYCDSSEHELML
eukprot:127122_1